MKKLALVLVLVLVYAGWAVGGAQDKGSETVLIPDTDLLMQAFAATGGDAANAEFYGWAVIASDYYSPRQAETAVEIMAKAFELNRNEYTIHLRSTGHYGYATMDYDLSDSVRLRLQIQALDNETIASVEIRQTNHRGLSVRHQQIMTALQSLGVQEENVKITSCLEGNLDARLKDSDILNTVYSAFNAVEAVYQEGTEANGVSVWSGWSPLFAHTIDTGRQQVNFGIALRWDSGSKQTIIRIATPVLPGSY